MRRAVATQRAPPAERSRQQRLLFSWRDPFVEGQQRVCFGQAADPAIWDQDQMRPAAGGDLAPQAAVEGGHWYLLEDDLAVGVLAIEAIYQPPERHATIASPAVPKHKCNCPANLQASGGCAGGRWRRRRSG